MCLYLEICWFLFFGMQVIPYRKVIEKKKKGCHVRSHHLHPAKSRFSAIGEEIPISFGKTNKATHTRARPKLTNKVGGGGLWWWGHVHTYTILPLNIMPGCATSVPHCAKRTPWPKSAYFFRTGLAQGLLRIRIVGFECWVVPRFIRLSCKKAI